MNMFCSINELLTRTFLKIELQKLSSGDPEKQAAVSEALAGMMRASKCWDSSETQKMVKLILLQKQSLLFNLFFFFEVELCVANLN